MDVFNVVLAIIAISMMTACNNSSVSSFDNTEINTLLSQIDENDAAFVEKEIIFDSIATMAGLRSLNSMEEPIKIKLFYFGDRVRGYYNLASRDDKNLQIFGRQLDGRWVIKCVTKLNMEEAGGYIILEKTGDGIWSTGHVNFKKGRITLEKQYTDYNSLENW